METFTGNGLYYHALCDHKDCSGLDWKYAHAKCIFCDAILCDYHITVHTCIEINGFKTEDVMRKIHEYFERRISDLEEKLDEIMQKNKKQNEKFKNKFDAIMKQNKELGDKLDEIMEQNKVLREQSEELGRLMEALTYAPPRSTEYDAAKADYDELAGQQAS